MFSKASFLNNFVLQSFFRFQISSSSLNFLKLLFFVVFIVVVDIKAVKSHQGSMNYYCNQTRICREQKRGLKSLKFFAEGKKGLNNSYSLRVRHIRQNDDVSMVFLCFSAPSPFFFHPSRRFFSAHSSLEVVEENNPLSTTRYVASRLIVSIRGKKNR